MQFRNYGTLTYLYGRVVPSESLETFKVLEKRTNLYLSLSGERRVGIDEEMRVGMGGDV